MKPYKAHVKIQFFAIFREIVGKREIMQDIYSGTTLGEILKMLAKRYGEDFNETIDDKTGKIDVNTLVMLNGRNIRDIDVKLRSDDLIIITVPMGGG
ncbi:MAG: MoaD family protein [Candidatus Bathyarchaeota archaeon]|nr:MAG: MoaD family protein [Candidatus Bathyarchaeota archaeon]